MQEKDKGRKVFYDRDRIVQTAINEISRMKEKFLLLWQNKTSKTQNSWPKKAEVEKSNGQKNC
jgi:hypothetical protein